jgi:hypothetical protein
METKPAMIAEAGWEGIVDKPARHRAIATETQLEKELAGLRNLKRAVADASSLIVMEKSGFLGAAARVIELVTIPAVAREAGEAASGILLLNSSVGETIKNDTALVATAASLGLPVISEDKKVLLAAERVGLPYYNAVMVLCGLLDRGRVSTADYASYRQKLASVSRYSKRILAYADSIAVFIIKGF